MIIERDNLISELHKIQTKIEIFEQEIENSIYKRITQGSSSSISINKNTGRYLIDNPNINGLCYQSGYYLDPTVNDPTSTPYFVGNYQLEYDRWYREKLRLQDDNRLTELKSQEYQIRTILWEITGYWKCFDKDYYSKE